MATGKNIFFICNGIRLHNALKSFTSAQVAEEHDTTGLGSAGAFRTFVAGFKNGTISLEGMWDADTTNQDEIDDVLKAAFNNQTQLQMLASFGTIANGGPALMLKDADCIGYNVGKASIGELLMVDAEIKADNGIEGGTWHFNSNATSTSVNGTSVDNGAATTNGGYYQGQTYLESDSTATDSSYKLQHSTDNSVWVDVESAQAVGATKGAISRAVTGTINRYTRIVFTATGGKAYGVAAFARR